MRVEHELRRLSTPLEDISATEGIEEARAGLREFLRANEIPRGSTELDGLDNWAVRLESTIEEADYAYFTEYEPGGALERFVGEADLLVARAGHRIEASCLEALLRRRLKMDFFAGPGRHYLEGRMGLLMSRPGIEHRQGVVILRAEVPGTSHFEDAGKRRPLCMSESDAAGIIFRRFIDPMATASCPKCRKYGVVLREATPRIAEDVGLQLERLWGEVTQPAALKMISEIRRGGESLDPDRFTELRRRALWSSICAHLADESRKQKCDPPLDLLSDSGRQLMGLWDESLDEFPPLPSGLKI